MFIQQKDLVYSIGMSSFAEREMIFLMITLYTRTLASLAWFAGSLFFLGHGLLAADLAVLPVDDLV